MRLLPFFAGSWIVVVFSLVAARSMLAGFERLNREVQVLPQAVSLNSILKKRKRDNSTGDITTKANTT